MRAGKFWGVSIIKGCNFLLIGDSETPPYNIEEIKYKGVISTLKFLTKLHIMIIYFIKKSLSVFKLFKKKKVQTTQWRCNKNLVENPNNFQLTTGDSKTRHLQNFVKSKLKVVIRGPKTWSRILNHLGGAYASLTPKFITLKWLIHILSNLSKTIEIKESLKVKIYHKTLPLGFKTICDNLSEKYNWMNIKTFKKSGKKKKISLWRGNKLVPAKFALKWGISHKTGGIW